MVSKKQRQLIKEFATDWIAQYPESSLISIKYKKAYIGLDAYRESKIVFAFDTPNVKNGRTMVIETVTKDNEAVDSVIIALGEQDEVYNSIPAHKSIGFNPMPEDKSAYWYNHCFTIQEK